MGAGGSGLAPVQGEIGAGDRPAGYVGQGDSHGARWRFRAVSQYPARLWRRRARARSTGLRDVLSFDSLTRILLRLDYILQGTALYEELVPEDFEQL